MLVLVRHGRTEWNREGRLVGRQDVELDEVGRRQAAAVAAHLGAVAELRTSPLRRARETCELAGFGGGEVCVDLREWDYGEYEGRTTDEIRADRPGWSLWRDGVPGGETAPDVGVRADRVIAAVRACGGDVLVFAHAHLLRVMAARWLGLPASGGALFTLAPATISVLGWERETAVVARWNDAAGDPLR